MNFSSRKPGPASAALEKHVRSETHHCFVVIQYCDLSSWEFWLQLFSTFNIVCRTFFFGVAHYNLLVFLVAVFIATNMWNYFLFFSCITVPIWTFQMSLCRIRVTILFLNTLFVICSCVRVVFLFFIDPCSHVRVADSCAGEIPTYGLSQNMWNLFFLCKILPVTWHVHLIEPLSSWQLYIFNCLLFNSAKTRCHLNSAFIGNECCRADIFRAHRGYLHCTCNTRGLKRERDTTWKEIRIAW